MDENATTQAIDTCECCAGGINPDTGRSTDQTPERGVDTHTMWCSLHCYCCGRTFTQDEVDELAEMDGR